MIDDSSENALKCIQADPPVPILLFGDYQWNKRSCTYKHIKDEVSFEVRTKQEGGREWWHDDDITIPDRLWSVGIRAEEACSLVRIDSKPNEILRILPAGE